jgi:hypothetical protein
MARLARLVEAFPPFEAVNNHGWRARLEQLHLSLAPPKAISAVCKGKGTLPRARGPQLIDCTPPRPIEAEGEFSPCVVCFSSSESLGPGGATEAWRKSPSGTCVQWGREGPSRGGLAWQMARGRQTPSLPKEVKRQAPDGTALQPHPNSQGLDTGIDPHHARALPMANIVLRYCVVRHLQHTPGAEPMATRPAPRLAPAARTG